MRFQKKNVGLKYPQKYIQKIEPLIDAKRKYRLLILKNRKLINEVCQDI